MAVNLVLAIGCLSLFGGNCVERHPGETCDKGNVVQGAAGSSSTTCKPLLQRHMQLQDSLEDSSEIEVGGHCARECKAGKPTLKYFPLTGTESQLQYYKRGGAPTLTSKTEIPVKDVVIVFHGVGMNPSTYFCYVDNALQASEYDQDDYYIIAVGLFDEAKAVGTSNRRRRRHFIDNKAIYWPHKHAWMYGYETDVPLTSFDVVDQLIDRIITSGKFTALKQIMLAGHGGGAQFVQRYAVLNNARTEGVRLKYMVANPSTFLYLTSERPMFPDLEQIQNLQEPCSQFDAQSFTEGQTNFQNPGDYKTGYWFDNMSVHGGKIYEEDNCSLFNNYPFGLSGAPFQTTDDALIRRFRDREVMYVAAYHDSCNLALDNWLSESDVTCSYCCEVVKGITREGDCEKNHHEVKYPLITSCMGMMQGLTRVNRAWHYWDFINYVYGGNHSQTFRPVQGRHSSCEIFASQEGQDILFGGW